MKESKLYYSAIEQNLAPRERVYQNVIRAQGKRRGRGARKAALIAAACLTLTAVTVASVPTARAAVLNWLRPAADPQSYIDTPAERRESNPALDGALESLAAQEWTVTVTDAASEEWRAWAERLSVRFDEILYDGESIHVTGALLGNTDDLIKPREAYIQHTDEQGTSFSPPDDMIACSASYAVGGGALTPTLRNALSHRVMEAPDVRVFTDAGAAPLLLTLPAKGLTGAQRLTLELEFADFQSRRALGEDAAEAFAQVKLRVEGLTFDATAGAEANIALPAEASVALLGDALVFSEQQEEGGTALVGNDRLSLAGGTLRLLDMRQQLGGTAMTLCLSLPEGWTETQCRFLSDRVSVELVIDGENQGGFGQAYMGIQYHDDPAGLAKLGIAGAPDVSRPHHIAFTIETGLLPEDWARIATLSLLLCVDELISYNGTALPENARVSVAAESGGWSEETATKRLTQCPLTVR